MTAYDRALEFRPGDYWCWYRRGDALQAWGKPEAALASYDQALNAKPNDFWAWYQRETPSQVWGITQRRSPPLPKP